MIWSNYFVNPWSVPIKKFLFEILKDRYLENEKFVDRLSEHLKIKEDAQAFVKLLSDAYQKGYIMALDQHREELAKIGMNVKIVPNQQDTNSIFNQKSQVDQPKE